MTKIELEHRLAPVQINPAIEKVEIYEHDPRHFHVVLTLKPNVPISERLIRTVQEALLEPPRSLAFLRSRADIAVLRFTVPRSATGDETGADRIEEAARTPYAEARFCENRRWARSA